MVSGHFRPRRQEYRTRSKVQMAVLSSCGHPRTLRVHGESSEQMKATDSGTKGQCESQEPPTTR